MFRLRLDLNTSKNASCTRPRVCKGRESRAPTSVLPMRTEISAHMLPRRAVNEQVRVRYRGYWQIMTFLPHLEETTPTNQQTNQLTNQNCAFIPLDVRVVTAERWQMSSSLTMSTSESDCTSGDEPVWEVLSSGIWCSTSLEWSNS